MIKLRQTLELDITRINAHGHGEADYQDRVIEVENTFPEDKVMAAISFISKEKVFAKPVALLRASPLRTEPSCPLALSCGGCSWQELSYEAQLQLKKMMIESEFKKNDLNLTVHKVSPSPTENYRVKIQLPFAYKSGNMRLGYFKKNSHDIVDLKTCQAHPQIVNELTLLLKEAIREQKIPIYDEKTKTGLLRHLLFRYSELEKKVLVTLVINESEVPVSLKLLASDLQNQPAVKGFIVNFNTSEGNTIRGKEERVLFGTDQLEEKVLGKRYQFSSGSFFQTNIAIADKICSKVGRLFSGGSLLDLYSGVGLYAVQLASKASSVTCVEYSEAATKNAEQNLALNEAKAECFAGDVLGHLEKFVQEKKNFDTVIVNPPRKGLESKVLELLPKLVNKELIYVSCSPITLARDLKVLSSSFEITELFPFDMFPHTQHVESVVQLKKK